MNGVALTDTNGVPYDPTSANGLIYDADRISLYLEDNQEINFRFDAEKEIGGDFLDALKFGLSWRDKDLNREELRTNGSARDRDENGDRIWDNIPIGPIGAQLVTGFLSGVNVPGFYNSYLVPDFYAWLAADPRGTFAKNPYDGAARIGREYDVGEEITAVYVQVDFANDSARFPFRGNFGMRGTPVSPLFFLEK